MVSSASIETFNCTSLIQIPLILEFILIAIAKAILQFALLIFLKNKKKNKNKKQKQKQKNKKQKTKKKVSIFWTKVHYVHFTDSGYSTST